MLLTVNRLFYMYDHILSWLKYEGESNPTQSENATYMVEKACLFVNSADDWCLEKTQLFASSADASWLV